MTTIPIEVIVQDAEAPIVPGEDGTNTNTTETTTNVAVPDTGEGNGNIFTGSASSIVLPVVLLVLALGSIVAILIHKYHKQKNDKATRKEKLAVAASSVIAVLAATVLVSNLILPATKAATSDVTDGITPAEDKVSITVTRNGGSAEASIESTATITSTSAFGYKVLLSMAENADSANLYLDGDETSEYYIAPITANDEESETEEETEGIVLADNTWGYALEDGANYTAVPLVDNAATVAQGDEPVEDEALSIYYGVKVSSDLPTGTYSGGDIEYTLEAMPSFPDTLVYMQDMTPEICAAVPTPGNSVTDPVPTATLIDVRDNKTYTIAKLADGNCWMTQNLDLDLDENKTLTPADTNINEDWTPANSTIHFTGITADGWEYADGKLHSADPGDVYFYTSGNDEDDIKYDSLADCEADGHMDCSHYHAGNYYDLRAAIANSATVISPTTRFEHAPGSICPLGWKLPTGPNNDDRYYSNYGSLVANYSDAIESDITIGCGGNCGYYSYLSSGFKSMRARPLWLVRAGFINDGGGLKNYGKSGYYWYDTLDYQGSTPTLMFVPEGFYPNVGNSSTIGNTIRCVAE